MAQIKELNKMEINNLWDADFKTVIIWMVKELSEDLNSIKKIQSEMKDTLIEVKNSLQGNNSRVDEAENQINDIEPGWFQIILAQWLSAGLRIKRVTGSFPV